MSAQQQSWFKLCVRCIQKLFLLWRQRSCCLLVHPNTPCATQLITQTQHLPKCPRPPCNTVGIPVIRRCCRRRWISVNKRLPHALNGGLTGLICNQLRSMKIRRRHIFLAVVQISKLLFALNPPTNSITYFVTIFNPAC